MGEGGFRLFSASEPSRTYDFGSGFGEVALIAGRLYRY
jgi:hypothetical protein